MDKNTKNDHDGEPSSAAAEDSRPWFIEHLAGGQPLTPEVQAVVEDIITPLYRDLVLTEKDPVLRAAGNAAVVAYVIETLAQPGVLTTAKRALDRRGADWEEHAKTVVHYLKITKDRANSLRLLLQLRKAQRAGLLF